MFREYALEPAVISNWERARYFLDAFGPTKGRFLAELPKHWVTEVYKLLKCLPSEKKLIEVKLEQIARDRRVFSARRCAGPNRATPWLSTALAEHAKKRFHAIIADQPPPHPDVIDAATVDDSDARWSVASGGFVARDAVAVVYAIDLLLARSTEIIWIDPYFRASSHARRAVFAEMCRSFPDKRVNVHVSLGRDEDPTFDDYREGLLTDLAPHLDAGFEVRVRCWAQRTGGERLHNRFIVTDIGGVKFGDSIAKGSQSGEDDHLSVLDEPSRVRLVRSYQSPGDAFDPVGTPFIVTGTRTRR